jgi:starch synthase
MPGYSIQPRILFVTPEVAFIPADASKNNYGYSSSGLKGFFSHRSEGSADFPRDLIWVLLEQGIDVHVAQPDYRRIFADIFLAKDDKNKKKISPNRVHLAEDRSFFYSKYPELNSKWENIWISLAFHREVINYILPLVQPDLIHCHDWMTGLIPAMARKLGIPCVFSFQNHDTANSPLSDIEDMGIDAAAFWQHLYFDRFPINYEETRETNPIDFLLSGIFAAYHVNAFSHVFFTEIGKAQKSYGILLRQITTKKLRTGFANIQSNSAVDTQSYINLYEKILGRPLIKTNKSGNQFHVDDYLRKKRTENADQKKNEISDNCNRSMAVC